MVVKRLPGHFHLIKKRTFTGCGGYHTYAQHARQQQRQNEYFWLYAAPACSLVTFEHLQGLILQHRRMALAAVTPVGMFDPDFYNRARTRMTRDAVFTQLQAVRNRWRRTAQ